MPTYEFACKSCGRHLEVFQRIAEEPLSVCPNCGGQLRKVFHPAGILLKGSGFYKTDNRPKKKSSESQPAKEAASSASKDSSSSGSSSSSKPASSTSKEKSA